LWYACFYFSRRIKRRTYAYGKEPIFEVGFENQIVGAWKEKF